MTAKISYEGTSDQFFIAIIGAILKRSGADAVTIEEKDISDILSGRVAVNIKQNENDTTTYSLVKMKNRYFGDN